MSANKPQPQQGGQKPNQNQDDEFNKGGQNREQPGQQGTQKDRNTNMPNDQRGQGSQSGGR